MLGWPGHHPAAETILRFRLRSTAEASKDVHHRQRRQTAGRCHVGHGPRCRQKHSDWPSTTACRRGPSRQRSSVPYRQRTEHRWPWVMISLFSVLCRGIKSVAKHALLHVLLYGLPSTCDSRSPFIENSCRPSFANRALLAERSRRGGRFARSRLTPEDIHAQFRGRENVQRAVLIKIDGS